MMTTLAAPFVFAPLLLVKGVRRPQTLRSYLLGTVFSLTAAIVL